ncbi:unnamed protein product [Owenia fusiformis]|uniref:RING-type E3 ubiquitin transferase n=1 Tax=Owenia fusiformis TaxID=6347 RepID=A0A8S4N3D7_OWEFU|nr:unnamed protein product [Owenia fusiformis]
MARLHRAGAPEVIRSNQKDEYYTHYLRANLADLFQSAFGSSLWIKWRQELDVIADLTYFGLTTVTGLQTLGEEYVNIVQVDSTKRAIPSTLRRISLVLLHIGTPYLLDKLLQYLEKQLKNNTYKLRREAKEGLLKLIPMVRQTITFLHRCHLGVFYMREVFYHIAKRLTGVQYLLVRSGIMNEDERPSFRILGYLSIIQLVYAIARGGYTLWTTRHNAPELEMMEESKISEGDFMTEGPIAAELKCSLCLEARRNSTATPCGHMYCWNCITEWCTTKAECPMCREKFQISRLIPLQNYDPT